MMGANWEAGQRGNCAAIPCAADTLIHPKHRDKGLYAELNHFALEDLKARGYRHVVNLSPTAANAVTSVLAFGWRAIGTWNGHAFECPAPSPIVRYSKIAARAATRWILRPCGARVGAAVRPRLFRTFDRRSRSSRDTSLTAGSEPRVEAMANLLRRLPYDGRIRHVRDEGYFAWRFRNPYSTYRFVYAGGKQLTGYLVLSAVFGSPWLTILDWEATDASILDEMLRTALDWGSFKAAYARHATAREDQIRSLLDSGLAPPSNPPQHIKKILIKLLSEDTGPEDWQIHDRCLLAAENWDLRMLMSDPF
jgi:hypothetical protein